MKSTVCLCVFVLSFQLFVNGESFSPCPGIFDYETDENDKVHGKITFRKDGDKRVSTLKLVVNFTVPGPLEDYATYKGHLESPSHADLIRLYNEKKPVTYRVHFPVMSPLPQVTALIVNDELICYTPRDKTSTLLSLWRRSVEDTVEKPETSTDTPDKSSPSRPPSPCPGIFEYETDEDDKVHGKITFRKDGDEPVKTLKLVVNYTVPGRLKDYTNYKGHFESPSYTDLLRVYNEKKPVTYRVHFPVMSPLPKITALIVNGVLICYTPRDKTSTWLSLWRIAGPEDTLEKPMTSPPVPVITATTLSTPRIDDRFTKTPVAIDECGVVVSGNERVPLINKGRFYDRGEIPWLVAIYRNVNNNLFFICGGTLVSSGHVVTAAHCMRRRDIVVPPSEIVVKVGVHSLNDWSDDFTVTTKLLTAIIHEEYNPDTLQNDIMILKLNKHITFNRYRRPACLWGEDTKLSSVVGTIGVVAGWGARARGEIDKLELPQMVRVPIVSTNDCKASKAAFHSLTYDNTLCAGDRNGAGPCTGDSGGGLYLLQGGKWRLRGVVSVALRDAHGEALCDLNEYVVFTDTAQFLPWIRNAIVS